WTGDADYRQPREHHFPDYRGPGFTRLRRTGLEARRAIRRACGLVTLTIANRENITSLTTAVPVVFHSLRHTVLHSASCTSACAWPGDADDRRPREITSLTTAVPVDSLGFATPCSKAHRAVRRACGLVTLTPVLIWRRGARMPWGHYAQWHWQPCDSIRR